MLEEGLDYEIVPQEDWELVRITNGNYKGVVVQYGKLVFAPAPDTNGNLECHFDFDIINSANYDAKKLRYDKDFNHFLGELVIDILQSLLDEKDDNDDSGQNRTEDTEKLN